MSNFRQDAMKQLARHRSVALAGALLVAVAGVVATSLVFAQDAPEYDPPLPPSMPEPPGKPQYNGTPTPDPAVAPGVHYCVRVPGLCSLADGLAAAHARGDSTQFTSLLRPVSVPCFNATRGARTPGELCSGRSNDAVVSGYSILAKQAVVASEAEFKSFLNERLGLPAVAGRTPLVAGPLAAGCALSNEGATDCSHVAITLGLRDAKTNTLGDAVVLIFQRDSEARFFLVGAAAGLIDGALVDGGPERRLVGGWTGNPSGDYYFEKLS